jgi:hypothetical protein
MGEGGGEGGVIGREVSFCPLSLPPGGDPGRRETRVALGPKKKTTKKFSGRKADRMPFLAALRKQRGAGRMWMGCGERRRALVISFGQRVYQEHLRRMGTREIKAHRR